MVVPLLAGAAKTMVISMLSEKVVLRVMLMLALKLMEESRKVGFRGIGFSQKGPHHQRFIHLDTLEREAVWSY
jgi:hypothetical protein